MRTRRGLAPSTARSTSVLREVWRARSSKALVSIWTDSEGTPWPCTTAGRKPAARRAPRPGLPLAGRAASILIVEDEYAVARGIEYALTQEGYEVSVARTGEEGLSETLERAPDPLILP